MRTLRRILVTAFVLTLMSAAVASAQQSHVISTSALDQAVQQRVSQDQADRDAIRSLLQRSEVKDVARKAGLSLEKAEAAIGSLQGDDLRQMAGQARVVDQQLAGGASTIVISTTTIIIVLLVILLIVAIA
jgi:hypothetical protein